MQATLVKKQSSTMFYLLLSVILIATANGCSLGDVLSCTCTVESSTICDNLESDISSLTWGFFSPGFSCDPVNGLCTADCSSNGDCADITDYIPGETRTDCIDGLCRDPAPAPADTCSVSTYETDLCSCTDQDKSNCDSLVDSIAQLQLLVNAGMQMECDAYLSKCTAGCSGAIILPNPITGSLETFSPDDICDTQETLFVLSSGTLRCIDGVCTPRPSDSPTTSEPTQSPVTQSPGAAPVTEPPTHVQCLSEDDNEDDIIETAKSCRCGVNDHSNCDRLQADYGSEIEGAGLNGEMVVCDECNGYCFLSCNNGQGTCWAAGYAASDTFNCAQGICRIPGTEPNDDTRCPTDVTTEPSLQPSLQPTQFPVTRQHNMAPSPTNAASIIKPLTHVKCYVVMMTVISALSLY